MKRHSVRSSLGEQALASQNTPERPPDRRDGAGCMWRKRAVGNRGSSLPPAANKLCALGTSLVSPGLKWIIYKGEMLTPYLEERLPFSTNYISLLHTRVKDKCFEVPQLWGV